MNEDITNGFDIESKTTPKENSFNDDLSLSDYSEEQLLPMNNTDYSESINGAQSEKLILSSNQIIKNPRFFNRNSWRRHLQPRPFDHQLNGPKPSSFKKLNRGYSDILSQTHSNSIRNNHKINNIQDIINQEENPLALNPDQTLPLSPLKIENSMNHGGRIKFVGTYRHPKEYSTMMQMFASNIAATTQPQPEKVKFISDPFHNYKPKSPSDVNLMALNQFRFAPAHQPHKPIISPYFSKFYNSQDPDDLVEHLYGVENTTTKQKNIDNSEFGRILNRNAERKSNQRPFSLMLDIYPMPNPDTSTKNQPNPNIDAINALQHQSPLVDQSYFNTINFPQLQSLRRPMTQNYYNSILSRFPGAAFQASKYRSTFSQTPEPNDTKPGKMIVHLNLHPRNPKRKSKHRNVEIIEERSSSHEIQNQEDNDVTTTETITTTIMSEPTITLGQIIVTASSLFPNQNHSDDNNDNFSMTNQVNSYINFNNSHVTVANYNISSPKLNRKNDTFPLNHRPDYFLHPASDQMIKFNSKDVSRPSYSERDFPATLNLNEELL